MVGDAAGGLLRVLVLLVCATVVIGGVLYAREIVGWAVRAGRVLHLLRPPAPTPVGPPLERIVRDLRRLQPEARQPREGTAMAKRLGVVAAYDDLLLDACRALDVPTSLASLPEGVERESERLRIEFALERAGVPIRTRS